MKLVKMTRFDGHAVNVHPEMVNDYISGGYRVDEDQSDAEDVPEPKAEDLQMLEGTGEGADETLTAAQVLELAGGNFMAFKSAAAKVLGDECPSKKAEIIEALKAKA